MIPQLLALILLVAAGPGAPADRARPSAQSPSDSAIARAVDGLVRTAVERGLTPGFGLAIVRDGRVIWRRAYGMADASRHVRAAHDTRWYLASSTKAITGFAMALLADQGTLPFTSSMRTVLPDTRWPAGVSPDSLTIARLLSHTHDLNDNIIVVASAFTGAVPEKAWPTLLEQVPRARRSALIYSNFGYNVAGMVLDRRARGGWRAFLDSAVLRPAGMLHTTAEISRVPRRHLAMPHDYADRGFATAAFDKRDATMHAAGGHVATLDDLARWVQLQIDSGTVDGRRVFPVSAIRLAHTMLAPHTEAQGRRFAYFDRTGWAAGWDVGHYEGEPMVSRFGGYAGMRSHLSLLPGRRIGVVAMANGGLGPSLTDVVAAFVYDLERQHPEARARAQSRLDELVERLPQAHRRALAADSLSRAQARTPLMVPVATVIGRYVSVALGTLEIVRRGDGLGYRWGVLSGPVRITDAAAGAYRLDGGGTEFTLRFQWTGTPGASRASAAEVNGSVLARAP